MNFKRIVAFILFVFSFTQFSFGQRPEPVKYKGKLNKSLRSKQGCNGSEAGTFQLLGGSGISTRNIKYLCFGDTIKLVHNKNAQFGGDPITATQPGIGYVYFDCKPTGEKSTLAQLLADNCINKTSPINNSGTPLNQTGGLWIARGPFRDGEINFINDGYQQTAYKAGKPVQFWFAPVTLDNFAPAAGQNHFENTNNVPGACIDLNIDSAFSIVYLNEIQITNITGKNNGIGNYTGTFTVNGGLPEFDTSKNYNIVSIEGDQDPNLKGRLTNGFAKHGKPMEFSVPKPGTYIITIEDENGCKTKIEKVTIEEDPVDIKVTCIDGKIGDQICIPIKIGKAPEASAVAFTFQFSNQNLTYVSAKNLNPKLKDQLSNVVIVNDVPRGFVKFFWLEPNLLSIDLNAEETLVEFCFLIKGPPGESVINIPANPGPGLIKLEVVNPNGKTLPTSSTSNLSCKINISPGSDLDAFYSKCGNIFFGQPSGGTGPYTLYYNALGNNTRVDSILFNGTSKDTLFVNVSGSYIFRLKDANGNSVIDTVDVSPIQGITVIDQGLPFSLSESCKGNDGKITVLAQGGTINPNSNYNYRWDDGTLSRVRDRLKAGNYVVTVTDDLNCSVTDTFTVISERPIPAFTVEAKPTCDGRDDGAITLNFGSSVGAPYSKVEYFGNGNRIGNSLRSVGVGIVKAVVTDTKGCLSDTFNIDMSPQKSIQADIAVDSVQCFNNTDGRITVSNRRFSDGSSLTLDSVIVTNLISGQRNGYTASVARHDRIPSGVYQVRIKDQSQCSFLDTVFVSEPDQLDTASVLVNPESCRPGADGSITVTMKGGTGPYTYAWADAATNSGSRTGLVVGQYQVIIRDKNGCSATFEDTITKQNRLSFNFTKVIVPVSIDSTPIKCFGQTTSLIAKPAAGFTIESYRWSNGDTTATAMNIGAGIRTTVEVTDKDGCKGSDTITLSQPSRLRVVDSTLIPNQCPDLRQATIRIDSISGGTGPYTFSLDNGPAQNFGFFRTLASGNYTVRITDANQCPAYVMNVELKEPPRINAVFDTVAFKSVRCAGTGDCTGQARLLLSGGTDPLNRFQVRWPSGEIVSNLVSATADSLCAGRQEVTIFDGTGCSIKVPFTIQSPDAIVRDEIRTLSTDIVCFGQNDGSVSYFPTGGTSPYKVTWIDGDTNFVRNNLLAGKYRLTITDLNNCIFSDSISISEPPALVVTLDSLKTRVITCPGISDGQIGVKVVGGNDGTLRYNWSPTQTDTNFIRNVGPGTYSVIVTDTKGCKDTLTNILMADLPKIEVDLAQVFIPICAGDTVGITINSIRGGNGASYSFAVNNGNSIAASGRAPLKAGKYQLTVFDRKGCALDTSITVMDPPRFNIDLGADKNIRLGDSIRISTVSNNPLSRVIWTDPNIRCLSNDCSIISVSPFSKITLTANATDQNGCKATDEISISVDTRRAVFVPNIFRPDQLSKDQEFRMYTGSGVRSINFVRIFNRFGAVVHEARNLAPDPGGVLLWDGRIKGKDAPTGVYVYVAEVEFTDGVKLVYKGDVTLIR